MPLPDKTSWSFWWQSWTEKGKLFSIKSHSEPKLSLNCQLWGKLSENLDACSHDVMVSGYIIHLLVRNSENVPPCRGKPQSRPIIVFYCLERVNFQKLRVRFLWVSWRWEKVRMISRREIVLNFLLPTRFVWNKKWAAPPDASMYKVWSFFL